MLVFGGSRVTHIGACREIRRVTEREKARRGRRVVGVEHRVEDG